LDAEDTPHGAHFASRETNIVSALIRTRQLAGLHISAFEAIARASNDDKFSARKTTFDCLAAEQYKLWESVVFENVRFLSSLFSAEIKKIGPFRGQLFKEAKGREIRGDTIGIRSGESSGQREMSRTSRVKMFPRNDLFSTFLLCICKTKMAAVSKREKRLALVQWNQSVRRLSKDSLDRMPV
jgi:hypothetical protein